MKTSLKFLVLLAAVAVVSTAQLSSAALPDSSAKTTAINYADLYYDYEVWAGDPDIAANESIPISVVLADAAGNTNSPAYTTSPASSA